jgi:hypothetical protein
MGGYDSTREERRGLNEGSEGTKREIILLYSKLKSFTLNYANSYRVAKGDTWASCEDMWHLLFMQI